MHKTIFRWESQIKKEKNCYYKNFQSFSKIMTKLSSLINTKSDPVELYSCYSLIDKSVCIYLVRKITPSIMGFIGLTSLN